MGRTAVSARSAQSETRLAYIRRRIAEIASRGPGCAAAEAHFDAANLSVSQKTDPTIFDSTLDAQP
jgi:hypothetical protein